MDTAKLETSVRMDQNSKIHCYSTFTRVEVDNGVKEQTYSFTATELILNWMMKLFSMLKLLAEEVQFFCFSGSSTLHKPWCMNSRDTEGFDFGVGPMRVGLKPQSSYAVNIE